MGYEDDRDFAEEQAADAAMAEERAGERRGTGLYGVPPAVLMTACRQAEIWGGRGCHVIDVEGFVGGVIMTVRPAAGPSVYVGAAPNGSAVFGGTWTECRARLATLVAVQS